MTHDSQARFDRYFACKLISPPFADFCFFSLSLPLGTQPVRIRCRKINVSMYTFMHAQICTIKIRDYKYRLRTRANTILNTQFSPFAINEQKSDLQRSASCYYTVSFLFRLSDIFTSFSPIRILSHTHTSFSCVCTLYFLSFILNNAMPLFYFRE